MDTVATLRSEAWIPGSRPEPAIGRARGATRWAEPRNDAVIVARHATSVCDAVRLEAHREGPSPVKRACRGRASNPLNGSRKQRSHFLDEGLHRFQCRDRLDLFSEFLCGAFQVVPLLQIEPQIGTIAAKLAEAYMIGVTGCFSSSRS